MRQRGQGRIFRRANSKYIWLQYYDARGQQIRISSETDDERKAERILRKKLGEVEAGVHKDTRRVTYESLRDSFMVDYATNGRKSLRKDAEGRAYLDKVARLDTFFEGFQASEIDADLLRKFIAGQQAKGLSNGTINRSMSALRRMFNLARIEGRLRDVPYFPMLKESAPRQGFLEREQYKALSDALSAELRLPLALGYFTGMRQGEILSLEWSQIDLLENTIRLRAGETKNDQGREIPIVPELCASLLAQHSKRSKDCPYVCFRLDRKGHTVKIDGFRKAWYTACVKAGLGRFEPVIGADGKPEMMKPRGIRSKPKQKRQYKGIIFHDLRRSAVRNLVRAGIPERIAMAISGHQTRSVFERYNITSASDIAEAGRKLTEFHASPKFGDISGTEKPKVVPESHVVQ